MPTTTRAHRILYAGFKEELTPEEFAEIIENSKNNNSCDSCDSCSSKKITDSLARHEVKTGDVFYIPAAIADYDVEPTACGEQGRTSHTLLLDTFIDNRKPTNITTEGNKSLVRKITNFLHISK